jgi:hypothetical protein
MPIQIQFTLHERELLLHFMGIESVIVQRLKHAMVQHGSIGINADEDELDALLTAVDAEAKRTDNHKVQGELQVLSHRLAEVLRIHLST